VIDIHMFERFRFKYACTLGRLGHAAAAVASAWLVMAAGAGAAPRAELSTASPPVERAACPAQPAAPVAGKRDGQFVLQADLSSMDAGDIASFILLGKEAAASSRPRDAEVAFLMACRVAIERKGADSAESADARYQLGWLYGQLVLEGTALGAKQAELRRRAEQLYGQSLRFYQARYGASHEKTRFAADGLAALGQTRSRGLEKSAEPAQASAAAAAAKPRQEAADLPAPRTAGESAGPMPPGPSFDCAKARSVPEKLICADAELSRLDRALGQLYARARDAAPDKAAFARQNSQEWRRREATCRDRECLVRWYGARGEQLNEILQGQLAPSTAAPAAR